MIAFCWRTGAIGFGRRAPQGSLAIARASGRNLRSVVEVHARHAYDGRTLLVPGLPEAANDIAALLAVSRFQGRVLKAIAARTRGGLL